MGSVVRDDVVPARIAVALSYARLGRYGAVMRGARGGKSGPKRLRPLKPPPILRRRQSDHPLERAPEPSGILIARGDSNLVHCIPRELEQLATSRNPQPLVILAWLHASGLHETPEERASPHVGLLSEIGHGECGSRIGLQ